MRALAAMIGFFGFLVWDMTQNGGEYFALFAWHVDNLLRSVGLL